MSKENNCGSRIFFTALNAKKVRIILPENGNLYYKEERIKNPDKAGYAGEGLVEEK